MYNNADVIDRLDAFRRSIEDNLREHRVSVHKVTNITVGDQKLMIGDVSLHDDAIKKVLTALRVKRNFMELSKEDPVDWQEVVEKIALLAGDGNLYARHAVTRAGEEFIADLYLQPQRDLIANAVNPLDYFTTITDALATTERTFRLHEQSLQFDEVGNVITMSLLDTNATYDLFNISDEAWSRGLALRMDFMSFAIAPFLERLVCTNGMTMNKQVSRTTISSPKFRKEKIEDLILSRITEDTHPEIDALLVLAAENARTYNASIKEYMGLRKAIEKRNEQDIYEKVLTEQFPVAQFFDMYATDIAEKSVKWLSTADSGVKVYDLINKLTWIASHPAETSVTQDDRLVFEREAAKLLFRETYDLADVAGTPYSHINN